MRKQISFLAILIILSINCYSQTDFENGYFINETNQKIDCLIKNNDWKNNPTNFQYKLRQSEDIKSGDIQSVKEFGIDGVSKYVRAFVKLDRSSNNIANLSTERKPIFKEEQLFLKVLIDGKASLFSYETGLLTRLFYKVNDSETAQLVYKRYLIDNSSIAHNNYFRQQLLLDLKCQDITMNEIRHIAYNKRELERLFVKYNKCDNSPYVAFDVKQDKDLFNLTIRPGLNISSLSTESSTMDSWTTDFSNNFNFRFGVEAEFILPFRNNKWAFIIEPTYQYFKSEKTRESSNVSGGMFVANVDYKSFELPVGLRYYFFLKNKSKIFVNASYVLDFTYNSSLDRFRVDGSLINSLDIGSRNNSAIGIGYKLKDRYSLEMRYQTNREILDDYLFWGSDYKTVSIIFGFSFF